MSKEQLIPFIKSADMRISFVRDVPALYNNSANKFFDSLAASRPILINHGGWQAEVIRKYEVGLVVGRDVDAAADKLAGYFSREVKVDAENIRKLAVLYSREVLFEKLYREAIEPAVG
ncbi:hypothetical protein FQZ97_1037040 [compost metagenome]